MSFREKSAWITLVTVLAAATIFGMPLFMGQLTMHGPAAMHYTLMSLLVLVLGQVVLRLIARMLSRKDERAARDERELLIQWRANSLAYYVLLLGLLVVGFVLHVARLNIVETVGYLLLAIAAATISSAIAQIIMFRRGS